MRLTTQGTNQDTSFIMGQHIANIFFICIVSPIHNFYVPCHFTETAFKLSNKQPIDYLTQITDIKSSIHHPEPYSPEKTGEDIVPSSNPDSPLVSFDMWSDLEEEIVNYVINSLATDKEQFIHSNENDHGECT